MSEETSSEVIEETAVVEEAAAALGDTELSEEEAALAEYKTPPAYLHSRAEKTPRRLVHHPVLLRLRK